MFFLLIINLYKCIKLHFKTLIDKIDYKHLKPKKRTF